ncbi:unnamed protein product [Symbiodinium natans]|uniref:Endonuclease/exonuclease/phosphatase domain-containing protein n=1 Tax=Symbiodinium natans TaxID=878477 RepID=A0A812TDZ0_9DINO|nr:unnamed protein product [Symbiodinium natans]
MHGIVHTGPSPEQDLTRYSVGLLDWSGHTMAFVNAHLNWGDYAQTEEQVREVEAAATELVEKYPGATVMVTGDFNHPRQSLRCPGFESLLDLNVATHDDGGHYDHLFLKLGSGVELATRQATVLSWCTEDGAPLSDHKGLLLQLVRGR